MLQIHITYENNENKFKREVDGSGVKSKIYIAKPILASEETVGVLSCQPTNVLNVERRFLARRLIRDSSAPTVDQRFFTSREQK